MKKCKKFTPIKERLLMMAEADPKTGCLNWTFGKDGGGYGRLRVEGKTVSAHRVSYEVHKGPIPEGMKVLHRCDNPGCINLDHLFLGTQFDNVADKVAKDRQARGSRAGNSRLTETEALAIRNAKGSTLKALAEKYDVALIQVWRIRKGYQWAHLKDR